MKNVIRFNLKQYIAFLFSLLVLLLFCPSTFMIAQAGENSINVQLLYKNLLNQQQINVYNQVYSAINQCDDSLFDLANPLSESSLEDTMNAVFNDHPELFWVNTAYKYAVDSAGMVRKMQLSYGINKADLSKVKSDYTQAVNSIVSGASQYSDIWEKEKYIYDAICSMNTYNESSAMNQSAYSALTGGSTVCAGYARAFQIICQQSGIPCYYVTGTSKGENHAWNIVYIDGKYYNVDLTWDDCLADANGYTSYNYFNKNDLEFSKDHSRSSLSSELICSIY